MAKYNLYLVIAIVGLAIITSGCTGGQDVSSVVKALPEVQQFMKEHPNAKIIVTYWSKDEVAKSIQEISQQCDKAITPAAMYKATISEGDLKIVSWINADDQTVICSTTEGNQTAPTSTAPIQTVTATPLATPIVTKPMPTPTPPITGYTVEFLSAPATAVSGQSFMVSWRVNSPVQENINHTAVHYGPDSKSEPLTLTSYPMLTTVQKGTIPADFSGNITIGKTGIFYFRAHAIIDGKNYWSEEKTITITAATTSAQPTPTPARVAVEIKGFAYNPLTVTISKGTTVTWTNSDSVPHTATSVSGAFDSGSISSGGTFSYTFNQAGTFEYSCTIHPSIVHGKVIVTPTATATTSGYGGYGY